MGDIATSRLSEERKSIRRDHPPGFYAKPLKKSDNSIDLMNWEVGIPGKEGDSCDLILNSNVYSISIFSERNRLGGRCLQSDYEVFIRISCKGLIDVVYLNAK